VPNLNLRRIIQDMIAEGGAGLYTKDVTDQGRMIELLPQKLLVMLCLGPPESDWNQRNFQTTHAGCLGGRKMPESVEKEFILFKDTTVSRRHFEISYDALRSVYALRDLGSAGGSFVRISYGVKKVLHPGMILLMGKHQFTVSSVDTHASAKGPAPAAVDAGTMLPARDEKFSFQAKPVPSESSPADLAGIMDDAEAFLEMLEQHASASGDGAPATGINNKLSSLKSRLLQQRSESIRLSTKADQEVAESKSADGGRGRGGGGGGDSKETRFGSHSLTLTCFAPDASPMQGQTHSHILTDTHSSY
jgi:pSer/pThr/pTyr-binding forkhead associated (FHA) protein